MSLPWPQSKSNKDGSVSQSLPATTPLSQNHSEKFAQVLFKRGGDIEAVLQRLDRLTQDEARMTVTQTLEVVYGLVNNVKMVMDSTPSLLC